MPLNFRNNEERDTVRFILDEVLDNQADNLRDGNLRGVFDYIFAMPETQRMDGRILGKFTELLLEADPEVLTRVTELPMGTFYGSDLTSVDIPVNITKLGQGIFALSSINTVNYQGTEEQWNSLINNSAPQWNILRQDGTTAEQVIRFNCSDKENIYNLNETIDENATLDENMTLDEIKIKNQLKEILYKDGFPTFAQYFDQFHLNLVTSEQAGEPFVAAIAEKLGVIYINPTLDVRDVSLILRHEIAHQVFKHNAHMIAKLKAMGIETPNALAHQLSNITGDYEISNWIYDDQDKKDAKKIRVDGTEFPGLVTELDFPENPEYWNMNFDQLWDVFVTTYDREKLEQKFVDPPKEEPKNSEEYVKGWNQLMSDYNSGKITKDDIIDYIARVASWQH